MIPMPRKSSKYKNFPHELNCNYDFEKAVRLILGDKAYHITDSSLNMSSIKKLLREALNKIRERIDEIITMDEHLRAMLFSDLDRLEGDVTSIDKTSKAFLIAHFLSIIGRLLGYDWMDGRTYRTPIYFRTKSEEFADYRNAKISSYREMREEENDIVLERHKIVKDLKGKGRTTNQIARILDITEYAVNQILKDEVLTKASELRGKGLDYREISEELKKLGYDLNSSLYREIYAARKRSRRDR